MSVDNRTSKTLVNALFNFIKDIPLESETIESIINKYSKSIKTYPNTEINIFRARMQIEESDNTQYRYPFTFRIRVRVKAINREEIAQADIDYLVEEIMDRVAFRENINSSLLGNAYIRTDLLDTQILDFDDDYYTEDVIVPIYVRKSATQT